MKNTTINNIETHDGPSPETAQALFQSNVQRDISDIKKLVTAIQEKLEKDYVTKAEFSPTRDTVKSMQGFFYTVGLSCVLLVVAGVMKLLFKV